MSLNYSFVVEKITALSETTGKKDNPLVLDYGCGAGQIVELGLEHSLDIYGADPYPEERSAHYEEDARKKNALDGRILKIEDNKIPFPDNHFDIVISNVVFEHVSDPLKSLNEIFRVLKPGGQFLALFPTADVWWEGHVKLYFAHWFKPNSKAQILYLRIMKGMGFGYEVPDKSPQEWGEHFAQYLKEYCFYRKAKDIKTMWESVFNSEIENLEADYMYYRIEKSTRLSGFLNIFQNTLIRKLLVFIYRIRAGRIILISKP